MSACIRAFKGDLATAELEAVTEALRRGELVVLPTETVYGVACRADRAQELERIKGPREDPYAIHLGHATPDELPVRWSIPARRLAERYWPGPVLLVLPTVDGERRGYRMPASELTRTVLDRVGTPVVMTSVNRRGDPPLNDAVEIAKRFDSELAFVIDAGAPPIGQPSTVVLCGPERMEIPREGLITAAEIRATAGRRILFVCTGNTCRSPMAAALARDLLAQRLGCAERDLESFGYEIRSAGILAAPELPASEHSVAIMREHGIALEAHRSSPLEPEVVERTDLIFALGENHRAHLQRLFPRAASRTHLLAAHGISDPVGGSLDIYRACAAEIRPAVEERLRDL